MKKMIQLANTVTSRLFEL